MFLTPTLPQESTHSSRNFHALWCGIASWGLTSAVTVQGFNARNFSGNFSTGGRVGVERECGAHPTVHESFPEMISVFFGRQRIHIFAPEINLDIQLKEHLRSQLEVTGHE